MKWRDNKRSYSYVWTKHKLIAHAAGGIDRFPYTNSKEAYLNSYKNGFRLFEIDISITSDEKLVARHDWKKKYGQDYQFNGDPITYNDFINLKYHKKYTPMDFKMVLSIMKKHPDIHVIIDGKVQSAQDTKVLYEKVNQIIKDWPYDLKMRLIPQMFYEEDLQIIRNFGFKDIIYVPGRESYTPSSLTEFCNKNNIGVVSLSRKRTNAEIVKMLSDNNIKVYMYTLNDLTEMQKYIKMGVHGFFTDFVQPTKFISCETNKKISSDE